MLNAFMEWLGFLFDGNNLISSEEMELIHHEEDLVAIIENKHSTLEDLKGALAFKNQQDEGINFNKIYYPLNKPSTSLLHFVLHQKRWEFAIALIKSGADPTIQDEEKRNALSVFFAQIPSISDWNKKDKNYNPTYNQLYDVILASISQEAINIQDEEDQTPLHILIRVYSTLSSHEEFLLHWFDWIDKLLKKGIALELQDKDGNTALHQYLLSTWGKWLLNKKKAYFANFETILNLAPSSIINLPNHEGKTLLHLSASYKPYFITSLLEKGADPNLQDHAGNTAFYYYLAHYFNSELKKEEKYFVLRTLLHKMDKESMNFVNNDGKTALYHFLMRYVCNHSDDSSVIDEKPIEVILKLLKENGFLLNAQDSVGNSLLHHLAISRSYLGKSVNKHKLVQIGEILKSYCDVTLANNYGFTAADIAEVMGNRRFAGMLSGGNLTKVQRWQNDRNAFLRSRFNLKSDKAWTTIIQSTLNKWKKGNTNTSTADVILCTMLEYVPEAAEDLKQKILVTPNYLLSILTTAKAPLELIKAFLEHRIIKSTQVTDENGDTVLHQLVQQLKALFRTLQETDTSISTSELIKDPKFEWLRQMFEILLRYGVDPNAKNLQGETALHQLAALENSTNDPTFYRCQTQIIAILRDKGADLHVKNKKGQTAFEIAQSLHKGAAVDSNILKLLKGKDYISGLPTEILMNIAKQLNYDDMNRFTQVSQKLNKFSDDYIFQYLISPYDTLAKEYLERITSTTEDPVQKKRQVAACLRKLIVLRPYLVKPEYYKLLYSQEFKELQKDMEKLDTIDHLLTFVPYRDRLLSHENFDFIILEPRIVPKYGWVTRQLVKSIIFLALNNEELWSMFKQVCHKEAIVDPDRTFSQIILQKTQNYIWWHEELALIFLKHSEFQNIILAEEEPGGAWLLHIFKKSIEDDAIGIAGYSKPGDVPQKLKPIFYALTEAVELASASFIIQHKEYSNYLAKAIQKNPNTLKKITKHLEEIKNNSSVNQETQERATQILNIINTWNAKKHIENLPSITLGNRS